MRSHFGISILLLLSICVAAYAVNGSAETAAPAPARAEATAERIFQQEAHLVDNMRNYTPLVETYIQRLKPNADLGTQPDKDRYFLGRLTLGQKGPTNTAFTDNNKARLITRALDRLNNFYRINYDHIGFMQMVFLNDQFDKQHYQLKYVRQQFLGEVRTLVFDVLPLSRDQMRFQGRIWVEDQDYNIVRINGTYGPNTDTRFYLHFDTWRMNLQPGVWLPAYIYTEETDAQRFSERKLAMKGQTRL